MMYWAMLLAAPMLGLGVALVASPALALLECDRNGDDVVDAEEARFCAELDFDELRGEGEDLQEKQFSASGERMMPTFSDVDENDDNVVSLEEWMQFSERRFAGATEASGGEIPSQDYQTWRESGMRS